MAQEILINVGAAEIRVAVVEDGRIEALSDTRTLGLGSAASFVGDILVGRVARVLPAVQAAFVDIGHERSGFLGAREARPLAPDPAHEPSISELVREGDKVLVQIIKDPIGDKGARLSVAVTLPGRLCVLTPNQPGIALSRRIEDEAERERLAAIGEELAAEFGSGCILRTAAIGATAEDVRDDLHRLEAEWGDIVKAAEGARPPSTLHRDLGPVERALRDIVHQDTARVVIDDAAAAERARAYCRRAMPHMEERIEVFSGPGGLLDGLEADIDGLTHRRVPLACGGWITIDGTEALTAVDVNSGSFTQASAIEDTGLAVNLEAAREIARQLRLRGIGGLIVIDFIHMQDPAHVERVLGALAESFARDRTPVSIGGMTALGLVEITRKRVREPLVSLWSESCPVCGGLGLVRRPDVVAMDVLRRVERSARAAPGKTILVRAAPEIVEWIEGQGESLSAALVRKGVARLEFEIDEDFSRERFDVSTLP